ncbi:uncharacterized protein TNCV_18931 [Trichonephila clavipes]|nr:uncharacterized protein TNCV_18931 [Trichonephila clavipes]
MRQARHLPQRWYWSIVVQVRDVIRQFTQGTPNSNTNPKATVFGIPKKPVLESAELITSRLTGAGSLPASRLRRSMGQRARNRNPRLHFPPVRVVAHGKHAGQTQKLVLTLRKAKNESDVGYIFEVDLEYPSDLHDKHSEFPLASENKPPPNCKEPRLLTTLDPKTKSVLHYSNLKLYLKLVLVLKKIHRVLKFFQSPWLKNDIDYNTKLRELNL